MMHRCLWPGCDEVVPHSMWGCRANWSRLPRNLRAWIGRAHRYGIDTGTHPTRSYINAHRAALDWVREHAKEQQG